MEVSETDILSPPTTTTCLQHALVLSQAEWASKTANCAGEYKDADWQEMNARNCALCKEVKKAGLLPVNAGRQIGVPLVQIQL